MTKEHTLNKDFVVQTRISQELKEKLDSLFVDLPNDSAKLRYIVSEYFKFVEKYPYLNINQKTQNPEDAGFPPCPYVKAIYWDGEFLGFHCRAIRPFAFKLPTIRVGKVSLKVTTPEDCWDCQNICRMEKVGIDLFSHITLESIREHKKKRRWDSMGIRTEGAGRPKVKRKEAFKLFIKGCPKKFIKKQLRITEATYYRIKREFKALSRTEKQEIINDGEETKQI